MIQSLRKKFIGATMLSLLLVLLVILGAVNLVSYRKTVADADNIYVMNDGEVVESGTHEGLLSLGRHYAALWNVQQALEHYGKETHV